MPFLKFIAFTALGSLIWNTVLIILGAVMGNNWHKIVEFINLLVVIFLFLVSTQPLDTSTSLFNCIVTGCPFCAISTLLSVT